MKKLTLCLLTAFMLLTIIPTQLKAETEATPVSTAANKAVELAETTAILARLKEIKAMDMSKLSPQERRHLRSEVRGDRVHLRSHGTVYITGGGLLLIIILLIILL